MIGIARIGGIGGGGHGAGLRATGRLTASVYFRHGKTGRVPRPTARIPQRPLPNHLKTEFCHQKAPVFLGTHASGIWPTRVGSLDMRRAVLYM
ncbi:hypothetical protein FRUB_02683 [Fimbriiglobus ruber]|uniref:Uncharacterized protein n=1 Tax=Fimbriiglobus ruber TaxID=1908690 RepID=A0A225DU05_9BACT|nr:hypothetical protein FRUB_02683 [Fimbriiglobus ruber]